MTIALLSTGCNTDGKTTDTPAGEEQAGQNPSGDNPANNPGDSNGDNPTDNPGEDNNGDNPENTPPAKKQAGWYMRTVAKATLADGTEYVHQTAGVFGKLDESTNDKDRHDIASMGSEKSIFQILFVHPEWDDADATYFSDYRKFDNAKQVWNFKVRNPSSVNLADADLSLSVEGMYTVYKGTNNVYEEEKASDNSKKTSLLLVDVDNQRTYSYDELKQANLGMDGKHTRNFQWVLEP